MLFRPQVQPRRGKRLKANEAPSKYFLYAFPKSFPVIFQRISSISEDSLGIPSPFSVLIRTSYMVSSWGRRFFSSGVRSKFWGLLGNQNGNGCRTLITTRQGSGFP